MSATRPSPAIAVASEYRISRKRLVALMDALQRELRRLDQQYTGLSEMAWPRPERLLDDTR